MKSTELRIASIQHGDYAEALRIISRGEVEPYFGMAYTLGVLRELFADSAHLVVSLNSSAYRERQGRGELVGLPLPSLPKPIPGRISMALWSRRILAELHGFKPTHVFLRTGGVLALHVLRYCTRRELSTLALFAGRFEGGDWRSRRLHLELKRLLNHSCVKIVGNHRWPATESMLSWGVDPAKTVAWDWPNARHPRDFPVKTDAARIKREIVYVGTMMQAKGIGDLVDAVALLHERGRDVRLTAAGEGPDLARLRARAATMPPDLVTLPGRVTNDVAFRLMLGSSLVCVPSRHEFAESGPLTLTESLATRTPTIISDHPVMARAFVEGEGVRFFPEKNAAALADLIERTLSDGTTYEALSRATLDAFRRVECQTSFGDLVARWRASWVAADPAMAA
jgi:glycosyltransferase involved in cell wall biosynthesis